MKIVHFVESYGGVSETFITQYWKKSNIFGQSELLTFKSTIDHSSIHVLSPVNFKRRTLLGFFGWFLSFLRRKGKWENEFLHHLERIRPAIIHVHFGSTLIHLANLIEKGYIQIPIVVSFYGYDISGLLKKDLVYATKLSEMLSLSSVFAFGEGPELCKKIISNGGVPSRVFVNPLVVKAKVVTVNSNSRNVPIKFLMIGRFTEKKGFHLVLKALGKLKSSIPPFTVTIIGFGGLGEKYRGIIDQYELNSFVVFLGKQSHEEVLQALGTHDFFIHPSLTAQNGDSEGGAPTIIIEAQAAGIPVIASNHADIPFVMGYHDFLGEEGDLDDLIRCIKTAINCDSLSMLVEKGKTHVSFQHDFMKSNRYESNLKEIIHNFEANT
ncbi:MAG: glycosyltransferase [Cyclobacteriaceae bacterium]